MPTPTTARPKLVPSPPQFSGKLFRVPEVAEILNIKEATVRKKVLLRQIGVVHLSARAVRIPQSEIDRIIGEGFVPAREVR